MANKPKTFPPKKALLEAAPAFDSLKKLGKSFGITETRFRTQLTKKGWREDVELALAPRYPELATVQIDKEAIEKKRLQDENKGLKADNRELMKRLVSDEELFDRIVEATRVPVATPDYKPKVHAKRRHKNSIITPIYDQQFGQFVRPHDTPGNQGEYSVEIFDKRLARWVEGVCAIAAKRHEGYDIDELIIPMGGDHVEGDEIFAGQSWQLELDPPRQVWTLAIKMTEALQEVIKFAKEELNIPWVALYGVDDNHGKVGGKKSGARPSTYSWNWLFLKLLFDRLREEPINEMVIEPGGSLFFYGAGHEFQMIHGHQIRGWGGLPFYGLTRFDGRSMRLHNRLYRYLLMGHHHQPAEIPNGAGETIVSGDWVGANNLSNLMTAASRPQQRVLYVSEKRGLLGGEKIYFADAEEAYEPTAIYGQGAENTV